MTKNPLKIHGIYRHFKGNYYLVEDLAKDSETLETMVVYRRLYGDGSLWVRPLAVITEEVNRNGQKYRFELVELRDDN